MFYIQGGMMKILFLFVCFLGISSVVKADYDTIKNRRGRKIKVKVINDVNKVRLVDIKDFIPDAVVDLKYARRNRVFKRRQYKKNICLVKKSLAYKLKKIDSYLKRKYKKRLKFWDCYRPWYIQKKKWKKIKNKKYVEPLYKYPKHTKGISVDVTMVDLKGKEVKMPTNYDYFSRKSWHNRKKLNKKIKKNRAILKKVMIRYGLSYSKTKWWHYSLKTKRRYPVLNFSLYDYFKKIERKKRERLFRENHKKNYDVSKVSFNKKEYAERDINLEIKKNINKIKPKIIKCFIEENERGNILPERIDITYVVRKNGRFYDIVIQNPKYKDKKDELNYCILKAFHQIKINKIPFPKVGKIPLEFSFE